MTRPIKAGMRFGMLTAIRPDGVLFAMKQTAWLVRCDCGREVRRARSKLTRNEGVQNCGCYKHNRLPVSAAYGSWQGMRSRCQYPSQPGYHLYGGRGISVCERWRSSFRNFLADMGHRPPGTELDRIDVNGNYEPGNCRWVTRLVNANNTRRSVFLEAWGERKTVSEWSRDKRCLCRVRLLCGRIASGWEPELAISKMPDRRFRNKNRSRP